MYDAAIVIWTIIFVIMMAYTCGVTVLSLLNIWLPEHKDKKRAEKLLVFIVSGARHSHILLKQMAHLELVTMGHTYRKYIAGLPMYRKQVILDQLLQNMAIRTGRSDIPSLINEMHEAELETIAQIVYEGTAHDSWASVKRELPNAVIAFWLAHPRPVDPMPVL